MMKVKNKKIIAIIAVALVAILAIVLAMLFTRCGNHSSATPDQAQATTATIAKSDTTSTQLSTDASGKVIDPTTAKADGDTSVKATETKASDTSSKSDSTSSNSDSSSASSKSGDSSGGSSSSNKSGGSSGNASTSGGSTSGGGSGKTYHEAVYKTVHHDAEYENVYVIDQEAYSYEEPVYEKRVYTVCHVCGAEFDTSYSAEAFYDHISNHALAGEGGGYHNDTRTVQVGTNTVNVPEEGHYEKKLVKAAWDEKVLVKEAGWY